MVIEGENSGSNISSPGASFIAKANYPESRSIEMDKCLEKEKTLSSLSLTAGSPKTQHDVTRRSAKAPKGSSS